jgi:hypothetical protein
MNCFNCSQILTSADAPCPRCGAQPAPAANPDWAQWAPPGSPAAWSPPADTATALPIGYFEEAGWSPPSAKKRGHGRLVGAMAVALIPLLVVAIVVQRANRGTSVGSATAQGAVSDLATAIDRQDVLGALASVAPEESAAATSIIKAVIDKAQQGKLIANSSKPLAGLTARVDGLRLSVHPLHPLVSRVDVSGGTLSYSFDPSQLAGTLRSDLGNSVKATSGTVSAADGQSAVDNFNQNSNNKLSGVYIMTVKRNGRWFVSPFYTVAEYLREAGGLPPANYDATTQGHLTGGSSSPEGVIRNLFSGTLSDPAEFLANLPPDSLRVVYDYMVDLNHALTSFTNASALGGLTGLKPVVKIDNLRTSSQPAGANGVQVNIDGLTAVATISGMSVADKSNAGCAPGNTSGSPVLGSPSASPATSSNSTVTPPPDFGFQACPPSALPATVSFTEKVTLTLTGTCFSVTSQGTSGTVVSKSHTSNGCLAQAAPGLKLDKFFIMTVKERGAWYVDPLGTVAAYLKVVVTQATPADIECLLRRSHDADQQQAATKKACSKSTMFK